VEITPDHVALRLAPTPHAARIAGAVALGMALRSGFGALAAERVRGAVRAAVGSGAAPGEVRARAQPGRLTVVLSGGGEEWRRRAAEALAEHAPTHADGQIEVVFRGATRADVRVV
jgi:hypothetical protein